MKKASIKANVIYQMIYEILALALPLITTPYISRVLGAEGIGVYSYTYSVAYYFGLVGMLGVKNHGNREVAKNRNTNEQIEHTFLSIYSVQLICSIVVTILFALSIPIVDGKLRVFYSIQIIYVISCAIDINWFFWGLEQFKITVLGNSLIKVANFAAIFVFVKKPSDLWVYCLMMALCCLASQMIMWFYYLQNYRVYKVSLNEVRKHLKPMLLLFIPVVAVSLFNVMDKIMVGSMSSKVQLGYYENSEKIINCVKTVITSFGTVMMPRMAKLVADRDEKQREYYMSLSSEGIFFIAFALCFGLMAVSNHFAPIFFGEEFVSCGPLMIGLAVSLPFSAFANFIRTQYLIPNNYDKTYIIAVITGAVLNVLINAMLIPTLLAMGAVIGTIIAEGAVCIVQCLLIRKKFSLGSFIKKTIPYLVSGIIMVLVVTYAGRALPANIISLIIKVAIGAFVYCCCTLLYWALSKNDVWRIICRKIKPYSQS